MYTITIDCTISNTISVTMIILNETVPVTKPVLDCVVDEYVSRVRISQINNDSKSINYELQPSYDVVFPCIKLNSPGEYVTDVYALTPNT